MNLDLHEKTAMVWGASSGLGLAIAQCLAEEGASTVLVARNHQRLEQAVSRITAKGGKAAAIAGDIGNWQEAERALDSMRATFGDPEILINNSGGPPPVDVTQVDAALWRSQFETMVLNQMRLTEAVLPAMRKKKFGRIISVSGTSIIEPFAALAISNSLRAALAGWMKTLASQVAGDGITVNLLLPGSFATERVSELDRLAAERQGVAVSKVAEANIRDIPAGRYGEPREFGYLAAFLASPKASYITGTALRIDGGATRSL
ncbi:MAG: SDR family oxidoreductase [Aestuariivirgaceae bacterium]